MADYTEESRRIMTDTINEEAQTSSEDQLREKYGQLWNTKQLQEDYEVHGFMAPFIKVTRKSDNVDGLLMFSHHPRWYHSFKPEAHDRSHGISIHTGPFNA